MKNNSFFAKNEFWPQSLHFKSLPSQHFYPCLCIKFCCVVNGACNSYMVLPLQAKQSQKRQREKSGSHIDPANMPSNSETSIFTALFRDNRHFYSFSLLCGKKKFVAAFLFRKLDFCKNSKSSPVVFIAW